MSCLFSLGGWEVHADGRFRTKDGAGNVRQLSGCRKRNQTLLLRGKKRSRSLDRVQHEIFPHLPPSPSLPNQYPGQVHTRTSHPRLGPARAAPHLPHRSGPTRGHRFPSIPEPTPAPLAGTPIPGPTRGDRLPREPGPVPTVRPPSPRSWTPALTARSHCGTTPPGPRNWAGAPLAGTPFSAADSRSHSRETSPRELPPHPTAAFPRGRTAFRRGPCQRLCHPPKTTRPSAAPAAPQCPPCGPRAGLPRDTDTRDAPPTSPLYFSMAMSGAAAQRLPSAPGHDAARTRLRSAASDRKSVV